MNNNTAQVNGILRLLLGAGTPLGGYLLRYGVDPNDLVMWIVAGVPLVMGFLSWRANSHANQALTASEIKGVKVVVTTDAPQSVQDVANDTSDATKDVVMAPPTVRLDTTKSPGRHSSPR